MQRFRIYAIAVMLAVLPWLQFSINDLRKDIVPTRNVYLAVTPGEFAGTLLLGGFRGIAVDVLWIRVDKLQREEKFFEIVALSDLISRLQPQDRMVWEFIAWNRAYNISVKFLNSREDRWKWVKSGLEKNIEGIRRMPGSWKLYKNLAFMFSHKCADYEEETLRDFGMDNDTLARRYYKIVLRMNPDAPLYIRRSIIHSHEKQGDFEKALELYDKHLATYPFDVVALQNRDEFMREKQRYHQNLEKVDEYFKAGKYEDVIEMYEDYIYGEPYMLPNTGIRAILFSYVNTEHFDAGIKFFHKVINRKVEDKKELMEMYDAYTEKYNRYYNKILAGPGISNEKICSVYRTKFQEKKVDISPENGIIALEALIETGRYEEAEHLLVDLLKWNSADRDIERLKRVLREKRKRNPEK